MDASALDEMISAWTEQSGNGTPQETAFAAAARAELAALRARVEDLELIARATYGPLNSGFQPRQVYTMFCSDLDGRWIDFVFFSGDGDCRIPVDDTGLPLLTAEARKALKGET